MRVVTTLAVELITAFDAGLYLIATASTIAAESAHSGYWHVTITNAHDHILLSSMP
jgi:hypothetical protein